jgi:hypothetical protein
MHDHETSILEYDRWTWHTEGSFPKDQVPEQGYVHIGIFLSWLLLHDMLDPEWVARAGVKRAAAAMADRAETPCALRDMTDGRLTGDMLTAEGRGFAGAYYAPEYGFPRDWHGAFGRQADRYEVPDDWETYDRMAQHIDRQYGVWVAAGRPELLPAPSLLPRWLTLKRPGRR